MRTWITGFVVLPTVSALAATRADYTALMTQASAPMGRSQLRYMAKLEGRAVSRYAVWYAATEAYLAREHGEPDRGTRAKRVLAAVVRCALEGSGTEKVALFRQMEFGLFHAARVYEWLREMGQLSAAERERAEAALIACANGVLEFAAERGAMNRTPWAGLGPATVARLFPRQPKAKAWLEYAEKTWQDWWSFRDTFEDASGYNALWLVGVLLQAEQLGKTDRLHEPEVERLFERFQSLCSPIGPIPDYGDAIWSGGWAFWVAAFERAASLFGRADFKHTADAIFRYASQQFAKRGMTKSPEQMVALVHACAWARDDLPATAPALASIVTKRRDPYGRTLLDKLVLRAGDSYVLVNLHDGGYHAHADGGAVSAFVADGSVLLHELGYHQNEEQHHNTLLVRPADEPFLFADEPFRPGRWYTSELDLRRPHTYTGGVAPDPEKIASVFFRIDDRDDANVEFALRVARIEGVDGQGESRPIIDLATQGETGRWSGAAASQTELRASVRFRHADRSERHWLTRLFDPPIDVSGYERVRVCWRSDSAQVDAQHGIQFGLNGVEGTQRWRISHRRTYRETIAAHVGDCAAFTYAKLAQEMIDCLGRPLLHTRELALLRDPSALCVYDTASLRVAGEYAVGPAWHVQSVLAEEADGFLCRDDWQWDDLRTKWASPARSVWIQIVGPSGTTLGRVERQFKEWGRTVPQHNHLFARWTGAGAAGHTISFLSVLMPLPAERSTPPKGMPVRLLPDGATFGVAGARCTFQRGKGTTFVFAKDGQEPVSLILP